ncbi:MAG: SPASM domain-containing protein [Patescibacteria group bacterium]
MKIHTFITGSSKHVRSLEYNLDFNTRTGAFRRWGRTEEEDPLFAPSPEIADVEVATACHGVHGPCKFCYKNNTPTGVNMSLAQFKLVLTKLGTNLMQVPLGIGDISANPDLYAIMEHCRSCGVIPNITINGARMTPHDYSELARLCGAVAVSRYDADVCYNACAALSAEGLEQVNIHALLSEETFEQCCQTVRDRKTDPRLRGVRAIVFLTAKPKGRGDCLTPIRSVAKYKELISLAMELGVGFGFDSCSAPLFLAAMRDDIDYARYQMLAEPCESMLFSIYVDARGYVWPCSFLAESDFPRIKLAEVKSIESVWQHPAVLEWRARLLATATSDLAVVGGCRECPAYPSIYREV